VKNSSNDIGFKSGYLSYCDTPAHLSRTLKGTLFKITLR